MQDVDLARLRSQLLERIALGAMHRDRRQTEIEIILNRSKQIIVAGFGNKGQQMARYLRDIQDKEVIVLDRNAIARDRANCDGFETIESTLSIHSAVPVSLGACQDQINQSKNFLGNHIFYEELSYLFNRPFHFNGTREFSDWVIFNDGLLVELMGKVHPIDRERLMAILEYRVSLNPAVLKDFRSPLDGMWFDVPIEFKKRTYKTFLDVGAFDGDTLKAANGKIPFEKAIAVEANSAFEASLHAEGAKLKAFDLHLLAAWSHKCILRFEEDMTGMLSVSEIDGGGLQADAIDNLDCGFVDFVKMDIEGSELQAIKGASLTLENRPDLAIAVYHRPGDIYHIYKHLTEIGYGSDEFDIYVRHYSDCLDDTIIYFIRRDRFC